MNRIVVAALAVALAVPAFAAKDRFKLISAKDLAASLKSKKAPVVFDANTQEFREKNGVIPGAHLLASYDKFDAAKEFPADKSAKLVFYCANKQCMASHSAANKACDAGFKNVSVMADGIQGWAKAGLPVQKTSSN